MKRNLFLLLCLLPGFLLAQPGWTGTFNTKYGPLKLMEEYGFEYPDGGIIYGDYAGKGTIVGTLKDKGSRFEGYFFNGNASGKFSLVWNFDKKSFSGTWGYGEEMNAYSTNQDHQWTGKQESRTQPTNINTAVWSGKWNTNHGFIILQQVGNKITGKYHTVGDIDAVYDPATKKVKGNFTNKGQKGYFEWEFKGNSYTGRWGWNQDLNGGEWSGTKQVKSNAPLTNATQPSANTSTSPTTSSSTSEGTVKFSIRPVVLHSLGNVYGFAGVQVFKLTQHGSQEIKPFGKKSQYYFNTTENNIVASNSLHRFNITLDNLRDFIIPVEDIQSNDTELQIKIFMHLKHKKLGSNKDYRYKTVTYNLKRINTSTIHLRSDVGPEIVQMDFSIIKQ
ncbi:hypothetical protein [Pseudoflavitalea rhizosphaerae]|uniref:hypothetical protein n=1 Tax=Pseudoflavitalea rhizosphaerae TaxID=1884793 RepID=UPI000F8D935F|nr:hypothetical protein [Pseudoflavitalea rhizosphaerae]